MPNPQMILLGLIGLSYLLILGVLITGILQLVQKNSASLKVMHRWAVIPTIFFWILVHIVAILLTKMVLVTFLLFLALAFAGALSGWLVKPGARRIMHMVFGVMTFLLFTLFIFRFLLVAA